MRKKGFLSGRSMAKMVVVACIMFLSVAIAVSLFMPASGGAKAGMGGPNGRPEGGGRASDSVTVQVYEVHPETIESTVRLNGDISSRSQVSLYPDAGGKLVRFAKEAGDSVRRGEVVAYVDPSVPGVSYRVSPVLSTISGTFISRNATVGDTVGTGTAVATVGSLSDLEITVRLAEKYASSIITGLRAYVTLISAPGETFGAVVTKVSPVVDKATRTIEVTLSFLEEDPRVRPGMFGTVRLATSRRENALVIPKRALTSYNAEPVVYVASDGRASRRSVATGLSNDDSLEVVEGLKAGDKVIVAGSVTEGTAVKIAGQNSEPDAAERKPGGKNQGGNPAGKNPNANSGEIPAGSPANPPEKNQNMNSSGSPANSSEKIPNANSDKTPANLSGKNQNVNSGGSSAGTLPNPAAGNSSPNPTQRKAGSDSGRIQENSMPDSPKAGSAQNPERRRPEANSSGKVSALDSASAAQPSSEKTASAMNKIMTEERPFSAFRSNPIEENPLAGAGSNSEKRLAAEGGSPVSGGALADGKAI